MKEKVEFVFTNINSNKVLRQLMCLNETSSGSNHSLSYKQTVDGFVLQIIATNHSRYFELHGRFEGQSKKLTLVCKIVEQFPLRYIPWIFFLISIIMVIGIIANPQNTVFILMFLALTGFVLYGNYTAFYEGRKKAIDVLVSCVEDSIN